MHINDINISMPVFIYKTGQADGSKCIIHITGKRCEEDGRIGFQGNIEIDNEKYDIRSIDFKDNGSGNPVIIVAGYNKADMEITDGITGYFEKDVRYIKGNLYKFNGSEPSIYEFAAPAANMEEASAICKYM